MAFREYEDINELKRLQRTIEHVLKDFIHTCDELDLDYYAYGGTCIGAVRHQGFIPWDDDVDVAMPRDDYEKFLSKGPSILGDKYRIDNARTQEFYPSPFSYLALVGTVNVPDFFEHCKWTRSIGIDIFPLDKVSNNPIRRMHQLVGTWFWGRLGFLSATPKPYLPFDGLKKDVIYFVCGIAHKGLKLLHVSPRWIQKNWERCAMLAKNEECQLVTDFSDGHPMKWSATSDEIYPLLESPFDDFTVKIPHDWDGLLTRQYGAYMELPPMEQRKNHYPVALDFGSY